jgi:hypothetical protein
MNITFHRFPFDPEDSRYGEIVIVATDLWIDIRHERPNLLKEPPYQYDCHHMDWSDTNIDPEWGAQIPTSELRAALVEFDKGKS